jgi:hypothetical protein
MATGTSGQGNRKQNRKPAVLDQTPFPNVGKCQIPTPKCQMKDEIDFKIDRIPPFGIFHWVVDIHGRSNFRKKGNLEIYRRLPWDVRVDDVLDFYLFDP